MRLVRPVETSWKFSTGLTKSIAARQLNDLAESIGYNFKNELIPLKPVYVPRIKIVLKEYATPDTVRVPLMDGEIVTAYNGGLRSWLYRVWGSGSRLYGV